MHTVVREVPDLSGIIEIDVVANDQQHFGGLEGPERRSADIDSGGSDRAPPRGEGVDRNAVLGGDDPHQLVNRSTFDLLAVERHDDAAGRELTLPGRSEDRERLRRHPCHQAAFEQA